MSREIFARTELLIGSEGVDRLQNSHVLVVGVGGVGAFAAEFAVRAGVGAITVVDGDAVAESNLNRQLIALNSTIGMRKTEAMKKRLLDINPELRIIAIDKFINAESWPEFLETPFDFVIDAIDSVSSKAALIVECQRRGIPIISSMGAAGRADVTQIEITSLNKSHHCKLAKAVRTAVRKNGGNEKSMVVFSAEETPAVYADFCDVAGNRRVVPGTLSYVVAAFGGACAQRAITHLLGK